MTTPIYNMTDNWTDAGVVYTSIKMTITDTLYDSGSYMLDISSTVAAGYFRVDVNGNIALSGGWNNPLFNGLQMVEREAGITAFAGGGQGSAYQLTKSYSVVATCATAGDSVKLPALPDGKLVTVFNLGAAAMDLYPDTGHSIDIAAVNIPVSVAPNGVVKLLGVTTTNWRVL